MCLLGSIIDRISGTSISLPGKFLATLSAAQWNGMGVTVVSSPYAVAPAWAFLPSFRWLCYPFTCSLLLSSRARSKLRSIAVTRGMDLKNGWPTTALFLPLYTHTPPVPQLVTGRPIQLLQLPTYHPSPSSHCPGSILLFTPCFSPRPNPEDSDSPFFSES